MIDAAERKRIFQEQMRNLRDQKFYVGFDDNGFISSVTSDKDQIKSKYCEVSKELAEGFLSGTINKNNYTAIPNGDAWEIVKKEERKNLVEVSRSFYKVPNQHGLVTLLINKLDKTMLLKVDKSFDKDLLMSYGLYICEKNCFHKHYQTVVLDPARHLYEINVVDNIDIYAGAHATGLGVVYG